MGLRKTHTPKIIPTPKPLKIIPSIKDFLKFSLILRTFFKGMSTLRNSNIAGIRPTTMR
jgi:hypothetical protein